MRRGCQGVPESTVVPAAPAIPNYPFFGLAGRHFLPLLSLNPELKADFPF
jgi:hypothetical protein